MATLPPQLPHPPFDLVPFLPGTSGDPTAVVVEYHLTGPPFDDLEAFQVIEGHELVAILSEPPVEPEACITMPYRTYLDLRLGRVDQAGALAATRVQGDVAVLSLLGGVMAARRTQALWARNRSLVQAIASGLDASSPRRASQCTATRDEPLR